MHIGETLEVILFLTPPLYLTDVGKVTTVESYYSLESGSIFMGFFLTIGHFDRKKARKNPPSSVTLETGP